VRGFAAVWLPSEPAALLRRWDRPELPDGLIRYTSEGQWHLTLRFFGELDDEGTHAADQALEAVAAAFGQAVQAVAGPRLSLLGPRLLVWPVKGLELLAGRVADATMTIGARAPERPFAGHVPDRPFAGHVPARPFAGHVPARPFAGHVPARPFAGHVTVGRAKGAGGDLRRHRALLEQELAASWPVSSLSLISSDLRASGAVYTELASYALG
jgi:2'-5' RNA ligase